MTNILVIDDSPTIGSTVEWVLSDAGYQVCLAVDGLHALSALASFHPDLILLDIRMPHIDGISLCAMIRAQPQYEKTPILILSGLASENDQRRAYSAGADGYLIKPVQDEVLLKRVAGLLVATP